MKLPAESQEDLARLRTELAVYNHLAIPGGVLTSWLRTGLALNAFGYTIYSFLQSFSDKVRLQEARNLGLFLIALGTLSILFGCAEYWRKSLENKKRFSIAVPKFPLAMAGVLGGVGVILFFDVLLQVLQ